MIIVNDRCKCGTPLPKVKDTETPFEFCSLMCKEYFSHLSLQDRLDEAFKQDKSHSNKLSQN